MRGGVGIRDGNEVGGGVVVVVVVVVVVGVGVVVVVVGWAFCSWFCICFLSYLGFRSFLFRGVC